MGLRLSSPTSSAFFVKRLKKIHGNRFRRSGFADRYNLCIRKDQSAFAQWDQADCSSIGIMQLVDWLQQTTRTSAVPDIERKQDVERVSTAALFANSTSFT
jgi:hypothetical protein